MLVNERTQDNKQHSEPTPVIQFDYRHSDTHTRPFILFVGKEHQELEFLFRDTFNQIFSVILCPTIESAAASLAATKIDAIIIFTGPNIDKNIEHLHTLRKLTTIDTIPVLTFDTPASKANRLEAFHNGFLDCIELPANDAEVAAKIFNIVRLRKQLAAENNTISQLATKTVILNEELRQQEANLEKINASYRIETLKRKELEQFYTLINKNLMLISAGNHALVNAQTERELAQAICNILVDFRKYHHAWVGLAIEPGMEQLDIIATSGSQPEQASTTLNCSHVRFGCRTIAQAYSSKVTLINPNIRNKHECAACWQSANQLNYNSTVSVPLTFNGRSLGVLNVYSENTGTYTYDEIQILEEVAGDLAYGISAIRVRNERDQLISELNKVNQKLEARVDERTRELQALNEKLLDLDKLKSLFIASMSHELRTPLNSIIGFTGIILQGLSGPLNEKQFDQLTRVYGSAKNLLELIINIIDISKLEGDKLEVFPQPCNLRALTQEVIDSFATKIQSKGLQLNVSDIPDIELFTDYKRLQQAFSNIVSNACKYTENGSISIQIRSAEEFTRITVTDTGIGIPPGKIEGCFEAFERLNSRLKVKAGGAGLGLYLTRKLVTDVLQGHIEVESELQKGSSFTLVIKNSI